MKYSIITILIVSLTSLTLSAQNDFKLTPYISFNKSIPTGKLTKRNDLTDGYSDRGYDLSLGINAKIYKGFGVVLETSSGEFNNTMPVSKRSAAILNNPAYKLDERPRLSIASIDLGSGFIYSTYGGSSWGGSDAKWAISTSRIGLSYTYKAKRFGLYGALKAGLLTVPINKSPQSVEITGGRESPDYNNYSSLFVYATKDGFVGESYTTFEKSGWSAGVDILAKFYFKETDRFHIFAGLSVDYGQFGIGYTEKITDWKIPANNSEIYRNETMRYTSFGLKVGIAVDIF